MTNNDKMMFAEIPLHKKGCMFKKIVDGLFRLVGGESSTLQCNFYANAVHLFYQRIVLFCCL